MQMFRHYPLWVPFERLSDSGTTDLDVLLSSKVIVDRSNMVVTCTSILCGMIYQQNYSPGPLNNTSKVLVTMCLLIATLNRLYYEGRFDTEFRMRVQETGPLIPTLRYIVPELLLAILLTLEGFKGGGPAGAAIVMILIGALLGLGSIPWTKHDIGMQTVT